MTERPKEFVVKRSKWLRGPQPSDGVSMLLNDEGLMCCLGFVSEQCGVPRKELLHRRSPADLTDGYAPIRDLLLDGHEHDWDRNSDLAARAIAINDGWLASEEVRESELIRLFAENGYTLRFEP